MNTTSLLRHINAIRCLRLLKRSEVMSRSDIARGLGLTRTTVGYAIKELLETNLVFEPEVPAAGPIPETNRIGRPSVGVALNPSGAYFVGLDVSTTALTAVLIDLTMTVVARFSDSVGPAHQDVAAVTDRLARLAERAILAAGRGREQVRGIGVSIPGLIGRDGRVLIAPFLEWRDVDLRTSLAERLQTELTIRVCNDAVAMANAVASTAGESETSDFLLILISEGIGSATFRQGKVVEGFNGYAGEVGQMIMAPAISPGAKQTFQLLAGHRAFSAFLSKDRPIADSILELAATQVRTPEIAEALDGWAAHLAAGFLNAIWMSDPEHIVIGGVLAPLYPRVASRVAEILAQSMSGLRVPPIRVSGFGAEGAAVGAAAMIRESLFALPELEKTSPE